MITLYNILNLIPQKKAKQITPETIKAAPNSFFGVILSFRIHRERSMTNTIASEFDKTPYRYCIFVNRKIFSARTQAYPPYPRTTYGFRYSRIRLVCEAEALFFSRIWEKEDRIPEMIMMR
jgi:hypothetical protein